MRLKNRSFITHVGATVAWLLVCCAALVLWMGISTHARAQMVRTQASQNIMQNSRGPAAFPVESPSRSATAAGSAACTDYKRQIAQLQTIIALQNQKLGLLAKK